MANMSIGEAVLYLKGDSSGLKTSLDGAKKSITASMDKVGKSMKSAGKQMSLWGAGITGTIGVALNSFASTGDEIDKMSKRTGISAQTLGEMGHALKLSGSNLNEFETGVKRMQRTITNAGQEWEKAALAGTEPTGTYTKALGELGLKFEDLKNMSPEAQFDLLAERIGAVEDPTRQAGLAMEVFGRSGTSMLPMLKDGAEGIRKMRDEVSGIDYEEAARKAAEFQDAKQRLGAQIQAVGLVIMNEFAPIITDLIYNKIIPAISTIRDWATENKELITRILLVVGALGALMVAIGPPLFILGNLVLVISGVVGALVKLKAIMFGASVATSALGTAATGTTAAIAGKGGLAFAIGSKSVGLFGALGLIAGAGAIGWTLGKLFYHWTEEGGKARRMLDSLGGGIYDLWEKIAGGPKSVEVTSKWKPPSAENQEEIRRQQANRDFAAKGPEHLKATATEHFGVFAAIGKGLAQKTVDAFATGGVSRGGLALVGERGPELVNLPTGARVTPAHETRSAAGGVSISVTMNGTTIRENADVDRIAKELGRRIDSRMIARGLRPVTI